MRNFLTISLVISAILATFVLQSADNTDSSTLICLLALVVIPTGAWLTDYKNLFHLSELGGNVVILLIVALHLGELVRSPTIFLAYSIANMLAYVQMVLFFRAKTRQVLFQMVSLSFLQVCVGCVTEQSFFFALLLVGYCFSTICAIVFLFLLQEKRYYEKHAFLQSATGLTRSSGRTGYRQLFSLAIRTLVFTPIYMIFGSNADEYETFIKQSRLPLGKKGIKWAFRQTIATIRDPRLIALFLRKAIRSKREQEAEEIRMFHGGETALIPSSGISPFQGLWEQVNQAQEVEREMVRESKRPASRFPMLYEPPIFSAASRTPTPPGVSIQLVRQLLVGATCSLVVAAIVFIFFPRFEGLEIMGFQLGHDQWMGGNDPVLSAVGFNETVKLGDLGPTSDNFQTVMLVQLSDPQTDEPVRIDSGNLLYFRGVTLVHYNDRQWNRLEFPKNSMIRSPLLLSPEHQAGYSFRNAELSSRAIFDHANDVVCQNITLLPLSTTTAFAIWPFYRIKTDGEFGQIDHDWFVRTKDAARRRSKFRLFTNAFREGNQVDLIPNREISQSLLSDFLEINEKSFPHLIELAKQWDEESELPKSDTIGRAKNLEKRLRDSGDYTYFRGYTQRNRFIDPLEDFISQNKRGHCEYFAGALALMLRSVGIPSRLVIGFALAIEDKTNNFYTIRQSDAHSWVEAWIAPDSITSIVQGNSKMLLPSEESIRSDWWTGGGWLRLDATPEQSASITRNVSRNYFDLKQMLSDFWRNNILNFNEKRQQTMVYEPTREIYDSVVEKIQQSRIVLIIKDFIGKISDFIDRIKRGEWNTRDFLSIAWPIAVLLFFAYLASTLMRKSIRIVHKFRRVPDVVAGKIAFYRKMEQFFARSGLTRLPFETPNEYIVRCFSDPQFQLFLESCVGKSAVEIATWKEELLFAAQEITSMYYHVRFGDHCLSNDETRQVEKRLAKMKGL